MELVLDLELQAKLLHYYYDCKVSIHLYFKV